MDTISRLERHKLLNARINEAPRGKPEVDDEYEKTIDITEQMESQVEKVMKKLPTEINKFSKRFNTKLEKSDEIANKIFEIYKKKQMSR